MKNNLPKVSILIPTCNQHNFIRNTINSVLQQTYKNIEIVISDDSDNDLTKIIIEKEYLPFYHYITYYHNTPPKGRINNYRFLLYEKAQGDWIIMLDGDDYLYDPNFIEKGIKLIIKNSNLAYIFSNYIIFNKKNNTKIFIKNNLKEGIYEGNKIFLYNIFKNIDLPHFGVLYNKRKAQEVNFYEYNILSSDRESILKLSLNNEIGFLNLFSGVWILHDKNISQNFRDDEFLENILMYQRLYYYALKNSTINPIILYLWKNLAEYKMIYLFILSNLLKKDFKRIYNIFKKSKNSYKWKFILMILFDFRLIKNYIKNLKTK